jgi:hypothetical protein
MLAASSSTTCSLWRGTRLPCIYLLCLGTGLFLRSATFADDSSVRARFLEEYRPHARALEDYYGSVEFKSTRTDVGSENTVVQDIQGKCDAEHVLVSVSSKALKNSTGETYFHSASSLIDVRNPLYSFTVLPRGEHYAVKDVNLPREGEKRPLCDISAPFAESLRGMTYLEMGEDKETSFLALEDRVWQSEPMKVLRAEYTDTRKNKLTIEYFFSPQNGWVCRGLRRWVTDAPGLSAEEIYFYEPKEGDPLSPLKRMETWVRNNKAPDQDHRTMLTEVSEFRHAGPFPDADFRLTAFGLPEPAPALPPSWPLWLRFLLGAAGLGAAAVLFAWLRHRFQKKSLSPG